MNRKKNRIPIESIKTCNSSEKHLGKKSSPPSLAQSSIAKFGINDNFNNLSQIFVIATEIRHIDIHKIRDRRIRFMIA